MSWADLKYQQALSPSEHKATCTKHCFPQSSSCSAFKFLKLLKFCRAALQFFFFFFFCFLKFIHNQGARRSLSAEHSYGMLLSRNDWAGTAVHGMHKSWLQPLARWWCGGSWRDRQKSTCYMSMGGWVWTPAASPKHAKHVDMSL